VAADDEILFDRRGRLGLVTLNRPKTLNAVTLGMIHALHAQLRAWRGDDGISAVAIQGAGEKAFCAGGDIRALYDLPPDRRVPEGARFYGDEYRANRAIFRYAKPYVGLIDGIVMGGGVGVSFHGRHRVAGDRTLFAMPETAIGLFPDVGGSHLLSRAPGRTGLYLGLTGARLKAADLVALGLATHYVPSEDGAAFKAALETETPEAALARFARDPGPGPLAPHRATIDRCFAGDTIEAIFAALAAEGTEWARQTLDGLQTKSPLSMKITLRQILAGAALDFEGCVRMEFRLACRFLTGQDFFEGVRAVLVDKDHTPRWQHRRIEDVTAAEVDAYFAPLPQGDLTFPDA